jgi:hypothetical protein
MKSALNAVRWMFSILLSFILFAIVLVTPLLFSITSLVSNRENLKVLVSDSGLYENVDTIVLEILKAQMEQQESNGLSEAEEQEFLQRKEQVEGIVNDVLTPEFSRELVENSLDGVYDYLEEKTDKIVIKMDQQEVEDSFIKILFSFSGLEFESTDQIRELPTCTDRQEEELEETGGFESIEDACLPQDLDLDKLFEESSVQFGTTTDGGDSFDITQGGIDTTELERNFPVREVYQTLRILPFIMIFVVLVLSALIVVMVPGWRTGLMFTGIVGLIPGILSLILALILYFGDLITPMILTRTTELSAQNSALLENSSTAVVRNMFGRDIFYSTLFVLFFSAMIIASRFIKQEAVEKVDVKTK